MNRGTAPCGLSQLHAQRAETGILAPEEVLKQLTTLLPDASSGDQGWTFIWPIPSHTLEMSPWSNFTPLYTFEVLLQHGCIPHPKWLWWSMFPPTPGPVTLVRGQPRPHSIRMRHRRMISKLSICQSTAWCGGRMMAADLQPKEGWNILEEAQGSGLGTR